MPQYRADFRVTSTLVLPPSRNPITIDRDELTKLTIRNQPVDKNDHIPGLDAQVIGPCEKIEDASTVLRAILAEELDLIGFVTNSAFKIEACYRVIEWEAFQQSRKCNVIEKFDPYYPPDPQLEQKYFDTIKKIIAAGLKEFQKRALKYFRYGLIGDQPEDQFQNFWLAIEIIAAGTKGSEPVHILCPKCNGIMACKACGNMPMRRPIPKEEIKSILSKVIPKKATEAFDQLDETRNALLHGRFDSVESKVGLSLAKLVDLAGFIAWHAIFLSVPDVDESFIFGHRDGLYINNMLFCIANLLFDHTETSPHPADDKIPSAKIEMSVRLGSPVDNSNN